MRVLATLLTTSLVVATSEAFAPSAFVRPSSSTRIFGTTANKVDASDAIRVAKEASETFGATSAEARIAWEDVEEIDASNSHIAKQQQTTTAVPPAAVGNEKVAAAFSAESLAEVTTSADALAEAERITAELGISSPEARCAWELVEELAATESHHKKYGTG